MKSSLGVTTESGSIPGRARCDSYLAPFAAALNVCFFCSRGFQFAKTSGHITLILRIIFTRVYNFMKKIVLLVKINPTHELYESVNRKLWLREATDGEKQFGLAHYGKPNLILMDISMPEMDELTATKLLETRIKIDADYRCDGAR